jgi:hypothetical protein
VGVAVGLAALLGLLAVVAATPEDENSAYGNMDSTNGYGFRAVRRVLERDGVAVTQTSDLSLVRAATSGTTVGVFVGEYLSDAQIEALRETPADVVLFAVEYYYRSGIETLFDNDINISYDNIDAYDLLAPACDDADAVAAASISGFTKGISVDSGAGAYTKCYPTRYDSFAYVYKTDGNRKLAVISSPDFLANNAITEDGNAALALRVLGKHPKLLWYRPLDESQSSSRGEGQWALLPPGTYYVLWMCAVAALGAALWRGRRFGKLIQEPLPVSVPSSESTSGLGRLYRQAQARGHSAAALRAATLSRLAKRYGLSPSDPPNAIVERLSAALGTPIPELQYLFYGPEPDTDAELAALADQLKNLEEKK